MRGAARRLLAPTPLGPAPDDDPVRPRGLVSCLAVLGIDLKTRTRQFAIIGLLVGIAPVAAWFLASLTNSGDDVSPTFFEVVALVAPLAGLALFVDLAIVMNAGLGGRPDTASNWALAEVLVYSNAGLLLMSESAALYAVAAEAQGTFLVVMVVTPLLVQLFLLTQSAMLKIRYGKDRE